LKFKSETCLKSGDTVEVISVDSTTLTIEKL
jgi:membrane protein implicated in regulation of membrane protease activity